MTPDKSKRRDFMRAATALLVSGTAGWPVLRNRADSVVWQIDPELCTQCGRCATHCVRAPSAVKCFHSYAICGYCDLCGGYLRPDAKRRDTGAENQLCPVDAIRRTYIEDPYYEYTVDEDLCIGCGICVMGCDRFGNGSLYLQINHRLCFHCNECAIAPVCPSGAFRRVPATDPYLLKSDKEPRITNE